ncbi:MAG: DUF2207 family protein [Rhodoglobus sp.]
MRQVLGSAVVLAMVMVSVPVAASADTNDFTFDSFNADYTLSRLEDGTAHLEVVETMVARFPQSNQNHGIVRAIPTDYDGVDLKTTVISVSDASGLARPYTVEESEGFLRIAIADENFVHGAVTYVVKYSQENVVRSFADTNSDEFYWDVNGTGWGQLFYRVSAIVNVEGSAASSLTGKAACYVGDSGRTTRCPIQLPAAPSDEAAQSDSLYPMTSASFQAVSQSLAPGQTMTVALGFTKGTFTIPAATVGVPLPIPVECDVATLSLGLLSFGVLGAAVISRVRAGRGPRGRGIIIPHYNEPDEITIMQSAHLMKRAGTAIPAALIRLAVRKNIRILAYPVSEAGGPYTLQFLNMTGANAEDADLLRQLFGPTPEVGMLKEFGAIQQGLAATLTRLSYRVKTLLPTAGFLETTPGHRARILCVFGQISLIVIAIMVHTASWKQFMNLSLFAVPVMSFGLLALLVCIVLAVRPLRPTAKGVAAREYLRGMRMYLMLAEQDRLRALQSPSGAQRVNVSDSLDMIKLYEKLLPWAILWGVEEQWMRELSLRIDALSEKPDWLLGANGFDAALFGVTLHSFTTGLQVANTGSSWSGSGGGSFSGGSDGGGSAGGGGGGGGGGGI